MAPRPLPQSSSSPYPNHSTQWHRTMAPCNGTMSTLPPNHSTLQWHPAMAPRPLPQSWPSPSSPNHSTLQWHPTMGPSNGTTSTAPCNSTGATSNLPKWFVALPPPLEVRTPIAIAIWGIMGFSLPSSTSFLAGYLNHQRRINGNVPLFHRLFEHSRGPSEQFHPSARLIRGGFQWLPGWEMVFQCFPKTFRSFLVEHPN